VVLTSRSPAGRWPLWAAVALFIILVAWYSWLAFRQNGGHFIYAQDDPYIHLALARTLATSGIWGLASGQFAPASSSPLWTLSLAAIAKAGGTGAWWPFLLNVLSGILLIWVVDRALAPISPKARLGVLLTVILVTPLVTLAFIGMEHTLHIAVVIALCTAAAERLANGDDPVWPAGAVLAMLVAGIRYEGLFVAAVIGVACAARRAPRMAASIAVGASIVPCVYAAYAIAHGGPALPNSVLMKSAPWRFGSWAGAMGILGDWVGVLSLYQRPVLASLTVAALLLVAALATPRDRRWSPALVMLGLFLGTELLHVCLVKMEWFFRYEAYVIALGLVAVALALAEAIRLDDVRRLADATPLRRYAVIACGVVLMLPLVNRAAEGLLFVVPATGEVYRQQYQMGLFFKDYYAGDAVALNDIGAVSWLAPVKVVDLIGLASLEVADARRKDADDTSFFDGLLRRRAAKAACIYDYYFSGRRALPSTWQKVGEWSIGRYVAVSRETVAFYAPSESEAVRLRLALERFATRLPPGASYRPWP
jgi:hypothetical protein